MAWAAGFFDGEGWAGAVRHGSRPKRDPRAQINQGGAGAVPAVLLRYHRAVGAVGHLGGPSRRPGRKDLYRWTASSRRDVERTWLRLRPWLGSAKSVEFLTALGLPTQADEAPPREESEECAWAAGFFDGDGSVYLLRHGSHAGYFVLEAAVTQSCASGVPPELERFRHAVGGHGLIYGPFRDRRGRLSVYRWKLFKVADIVAMCELLWPWLGNVKRTQAERALGVIRSQPQLARGNPAWGSRKTHCVHGHEYATARILPYRSRGKGIQRRDSKQCLTCLREYAGRQREVRRTQRSAAEAADPAQQRKPTC